MNRNKCTVVKAHAQLDALTERILAQLGEEGAAIRRRLQLFYRRRSTRGQPVCVAASQEMPLPRAERRSMA
jgi:hypothetical protein